MTVQVADLSDDMLEDAWHRRAARETCTLSYSAYGMPIHVSANDQRLLEAARYASQRYSRCQVIASIEPMQMHLVVDQQRGLPIIPHDWVEHLRYQAVGPWLVYGQEPSLQVAAHLGQRTAVAMVASTLADSLNLVSRCVYDTVTLNMVMRLGLGMLHASCLQRGDTAVLLSAAHNTGKSTTALHLALDGWGLVSDGMTYVRPAGERFELLGYPVGEAKLRFDVLDQFPQLAELGEATRVREHTKMVFNLRQALPGVVVEESILPEKIILCHLARHDGKQSLARRVDWHTLFPVLWQESSFLDEPAVLASDRRVLQAMLDRTCCYELTLGSNTASTIALVNELTSSS